ncbi:MAG: NAD(P)-dependent oxidoreductase, partial [Caldilineaceae bacterium]
MKPKILVDPAFRKMAQIFAPADLARLREMADVIWAKDEPMPAKDVAEIKGELFAILTGRWRHGAVTDAPKLRAIVELGGVHPTPQDLDYEACFARGVRVLSCAPAFGPAVAEMALAMTLAVKRQLVDSHNDFVAGKERYLEAGTVGSTMLFDRTVGFIGFGGLARNLRPLLAPFRCKVQVYDPWLPKRYLERQGVKSVGLEELLYTSHVVYVLAVPSASNRAL